MPPRSAALGVLFVHGIGQPRQKDTLHGFAEPLCQWIDARLRAVAAGRVAPESVLLEYPLQQDGITPAHAELSIPSLDRDAPPARWLLAEAWWARDIGTPTFRAM